MLRIKAVAAGPVQEKADAGAVAADGFAIDVLPPVGGRAGLAPAAAGMRS
jgi:hypothetical protein